MIQVKFIRDVDLENPASIEKAFAELAPMEIAKCNWPEAYPYVPQVKLRMFHTGGHLLLKYEVREKCTAARVACDNGPVWTDSCVEFFFQPGGEAKYYNLEASCIGKILMGWRSGRNDPQPATDEQLAAIRRYPSLGTEPFDEMSGDNSWSLILDIPASAYSHSDIKSFAGLTGRCNAYKCGDNLSTPHYVTLAPITTPSPDYHRPEFFTEISFEI